MRILAFAVALAASACTADQMPVTDTSGASFDWVCSDDTCSVEAQQGTPQVRDCANGTGHYAWALGRFVEILSVCENQTGWVAGVNFDRPLACKNESDCPQFANATFGCRSGICQNEDAATFPAAFVNWREVNILCYASYARSETPTTTNMIGLQISDWVDSVCPSEADESPCMLPLPGACMQP